MFQNVMTVSLLQNDFVYASLKKEHYFFHGDKNINISKENTER